MKNIPPRRVFITIALICTSLLAAAFYLQYGPAKAQPCPLCILQRYAYSAIALTSLLAASFNSRGIALLGFCFVTDLLAVAGLGCALWQVSKGASMTSCLVDPVGVFVNGLPSANWWPTFFFANGSCADQYPPLFGLSIPVWSAIGFASLTIAIGLMAAVSIQSLRK